MAGRVAGAPPRRHRGKTGMLEQGRGWDGSRFPGWVDVARERRVWGHAGAEVTVWGGWGRPALSPACDHTTFSTWPPCTGLAPPSPPSAATAPPIRRGLIPMLLPLHEDHRIAALPQEPSARPQLLFSLGLVLRPLEEGMASAVPASPWPAVNPTRTAQSRKALSSWTLPRAVALAAVWSHSSGSGASIPLWEAALPLVRPRGHGGHGTETWLLRAQG